MVRITPFLILLLLAVPSLAQSPDPGLLGDTVEPVLDPVVGTVLPPAENTTGDDLHSEELDIVTDLDVRNIEYQPVGILFGGGKIQADLRAKMSLDFYAVKAERLDDAMRASSGNDNVSLRDTFGIPSSRVAITAEEIRAIGGGALLEMFQTQQEGLATSYVLNMVPGLRILGLETSWTNTEPLSDYTALVSDPNEFEPGIPSLRNPPIILDVIVDLQYIDRLSLYDIMEGVLTSDKNDTETSDDILKQEIKDTQELPFYKKSAFQVIGIGQLLNLQLEPGWTLDVSLTVPKGFTVEGVTDELARTDDRLTAQYFLDGSDRDAASDSAGIVTVSNRFLVTAVLAAAILLVGGILRASTEIGTIEHMRRKHRKREL